MNPIATDGFTVTVTRPRSHLGQAELCVGPDSVTLIVRPLRHYRGIVLSFVAAFAVLVLIGGVFSWSGAMPLKEPGLSGPAHTEALVMAYGAPALVGVLVGVLAGGMLLLFKALRGDPRSMTLPLTRVSLVKHKGRVLVLSAAFDAGARPRSWTLSARSRDDAEAIASAPTTSGG